MSLAQCFDSQWGSFKCCFGVIPGYLCLVLEIATLPGKAACVFPGSFLLTGIRLLNCGKVGHYRHEA